MAEEEVLPKSKAKAKQQAKTHYLCKSCLNNFWGAKAKPKCPVCGNEFNCLELTAEGLPLEQVRELVESSRIEDAEIMNPEAYEKSNEKPRLKIDLTRDTREVMEEMDQVSTDMFKRDMNKAYIDHLASGAKAVALESKRKLMEEEKKIKALESNDDEPPEYQQVAPNPQGAVMLMQTIAGFPEEQQELFFERIKDPQVAHNLATILNPPKQTMYGVAPNMPNPMGMAMQSVMGTPTPPAALVSPQDNTPNIADLMDVVSSMMFKQQEMALKQQEMALKQQPPENNDIKDLLAELKQDNAKLTERYYELKHPEIGMSNNPGLTKEDVQELMERVTNEKLKDLKPKDLAEQFKDMKNVMVAADTFRDSIKGELPEQRESYDEWHKRFTVKTAAEKEKLLMEQKLHEIDRDKASYDTASKLMAIDKIRENSKEKKKEDKKEEPKKEKKEEVKPAKKLPLNLRGAVR